MDSSSQQNARRGMVTGTTGGPAIDAGVEILRQGGSVARKLVAAVRALGQDVVEDDTLRGYWLGIQIDRKSGQLHGGSIRELQLGGRAVGY